MENTKIGNQDAQEVQTTPWNLVALKMRRSTLRGWSSSSFILLLSFDVRILGLNTYFYGLCGRFCVRVPISPLGFFNITLD